MIIVKSKFLLEELIKTSMYVVHISPKSFDSLVVNGTSNYYASAIKATVHQHKLSNFDVSPALVTSKKYNHQQYFV